MRVLFFNRFDWSTNMGGDTIQMLKTKEFLQKLGVQVEIAKGYNYDLNILPKVNIKTLHTINQILNLKIHA